MPSAVTLAVQPVIAASRTPLLIGGASTDRVTRRTDTDTSGMFHYLEIGPDWGKATAQFLAEAIRPRPDREREPVLAGKQLRTLSSRLSARESADRLARWLAAVAGHPAPSPEHRAPSAE